MIARAQAMKTMLELISRCRCESWEQCGNALVANPGAASALSIATVSARA